MHECFISSTLGNSCLFKLLRMSCCGCLDNYHCVRKPFPALDRGEMSFGTNVNFQHFLY